MILENYYYYFQSAIPSHTCDEIIKFAKQFKKERGLINHHQPKKTSTKKIKEIRQVRESHIVFLDEKWLYNLLQPFVREANYRANWNFDWDWSESIQFTIYKKNQFYDWHADSFPQQDKNGKVRKLSVSINLSDPKDYEGGLLEFDFRNQNKNPSFITQCKEILPKGSLVVFPSFVFHRVTPVTKGTRYSLVMWNKGPAFK